ncbi:MAG: xanthine dehydrogenase family protein molybdopterin-binding subunit [Acidobacteriia bacterium]|nr:xanthine dehydrogenase family protein molybdopterin-binding subunit [Terriglobia bacterium]
MKRRTFLQSAIGGLVVAFELPTRSRAAASKLNAYVHVGSDDVVTLFIAKGEMGQGTVTSISQLLADELECDWKKIRTEFPGVSREYGFQGVVGSASIRTGWEPLRKAGATAREMLIAAAAQKWGVDRSQCRAENSAVVNTATGQRATYGSLAEAAANIAPPANVKLKDPENFRLIGQPVKRIDTPSKVDGSATFGLDVRRPGMLYAVVARCPVFGGKVAGFDDSKAKAVAGVKRVVQISTGVAVVAENTWSAMEGCRALAVKFDEGARAALTSAEISRQFADRMDKAGAVARKDGDAASAMASAAKKIEAAYEVPFLAHAPMEPLNCVAEVSADSCEVWASTQMQTPARDLAAKVSGVGPEKTQVHTEYMGGGFGRRGGVDYIGEAVEVAKAIGAPVKLTWSREDDLQHDLYRPASLTHFAGGLDAEGWPVALTSRIACPPFGGVRDGLSRTGVEGVSTMPYSIPNVFVDYHAVDPGIPVSFWRSVGYSQNVFFTESFLDEMAAAGSKDPLEVRLRLLANQPRLKAALQLAAEKAGWGKPLASGKGRGLSVANNIGSFTAQVAEVSVDKGKVRVDRVVCAVDCGHVVNPAIVEQQIQSGIVFGLTAALKGGITIDRGRVEQSNFDKYDALRIDEMPRVEVHIVPSRNAPGGIGEASTPGIAPAVANAIFQATGKRVRRLPIRIEA